MNLVRPITDTIKFTEQWDEDKGLDRHESDLR